MKKETFVKIINALKLQDTKSDVFCKTIQSAFLEFGEDIDFRDKYSYAPPTQELFDSIIESLALEFSLNYENQQEKYEEKLDNLNWWIYETNYGSDFWGKPIVMINEKDFEINTPEMLYDLLNDNLK